MQLNVVTRSSTSAMTPSPYRKLLVIALVCAAGAVLVWRDRAIEQQSVSAVSSTAVPDAPTNTLNRGDSANEASGVSLLPSDRQSGSALAGNVTGPRTFIANGLGLFNESARSLMRSSELAKIDYGRLRLNSECRSFILGGDGASLVRETGISLSQIKGVQTLLVGNATDEARMAGFSRSLERCRNLYEGTPITREEFALIDKLPGGMQYRAIRSTLLEAKDFDNPQSKAALTQAVSAPMYGVLASLLVSKVDYSELMNSYSAEQVDALYTLVLPLVLCRMGDDCSRGGIVTEQLCWQNGICGENTEEAIWANLRFRGLDTAALNQFVTRVIQAFQNGDTSIFRKPKPTK